jgi:predicted negative regulator of RcsB-dependent stress response
MLNKQEIIKTIAIIWILGSILYIGYDTWNDYKIRGIQQAYQAGIDDSMKQIFDKNKESQCKQPIEISFQGNKLNIIDIACLQQPKETEQNKTAPVKK